MSPLKVLESQMPNRYLLTLQIPLPQRSIGYVNMKLQEPTTQKQLNEQTSARCTSLIPGTWAVEIVLSSALPHFAGASKDWGPFEGVDRDA